MLPRAPGEPEREPFLLGRTVSQDVTLLAMICLVDLATTLWWISQGQAREANPLMAYFLQQGHVPFIVAKLVFFVPALVIAEWYRPRNPRFISRLLQGVTVAYLAAYLIGIAPHLSRLFHGYGEMLLG